MTTLVYKFHCEPPTDGAGIVRAQLRAAHSYHNDLVAIERGRRAAIRGRLEQLPSVRDALAAVRTATRSTRRAAREQLASALRAALTLAPSQRALCRLLEQVLDVPLDALPHHVAIARIERLAAELRRGARALTDLAWGSYQTVEASADQVRKDVPLYDDKGEPTDPRFRHARRDGRVDGQVSVHIQNRTLTVADALACKDRWIRFALRPMRDPSTRRGRRRYGDLHLRVGSIGRDPVWAVVPIQVDRAMPDLASIEWVRLSCRQDGPWERWSCEVTLTMPDGYRRPRELAQNRRGAIALVVEWVETDGRVRVGRWADDEGAGGELWLDESLVRWLRKAEGIRSVRDMILNELRPRLAERLRAWAHTHPDGSAWLRDVAAGMHLWRSPSRFHELARRWRRERLDEARDAYEMLDAWEMRDAHLYEYEAGARRGALGARRDLYRTTAAQWAARYRVVILEKRNLSFEARRPDEPGVSEQTWRQLAGVYELVGAMRNAFGPAGAWESPRLAGAPVDEDGDPLPEPGAEVLIERWREAGMPGVARSIREESDSERVAAGAWARRKARKRAALAAEEAARNG